MEEVGEGGRGAERGGGCAARKPACALSSSREDGAEESGEKRAWDSRERGRGGFFAVSCFLSFLTVGLFSAVLVSNICSETTLTAADTASPFNCTSRQTICAIIACLFVKHTSCLLRNPREISRGPFRLARKPIQGELPRKQPHHCSPRPTLHKRQRGRELS